MPSRVLVIDDNPTNLELIVYLLEAFGYQVESATDGMSGLERAMASPHPDLIICDIQLPRLDGNEVVRRLKADPRLRAIPVIAVTALAMVGDRERILESGFDGYFTKPIQPEVFIQQIAPFLGPHTAPTLAPGTGESSEVTPPAATAAPGARLLVVDNTDDNLELARNLFGPSGYHVDVASGPEEALRKALVELPDLILCDVCMDDSNGFDFIQVLKADPRLASIPFIFLTSSMVEPADRQRGLGYGAQHFLVRPMDSGELLRIVNACLLKSHRSAA